MRQYGRLGRYKIMTTFSQIMSAMSEMDAETKDRLTKILGGTNCRTPFYIVKDIDLETDVIISLLDLGINNDGSDKGVDNEI
jgi:hypothetical protein